MPGPGTELLSVIVTTADAATNLPTLVGGLDAQTLPTSAFEVLFADQGSTDGSLERLQRLAVTRPNVTVLSGGVDAAVEVATGGWLLVLDQRDRLLPDALTRLAAAATDEVDLVVGRRLLGEHDAAGPWAPDESGSSGPDGGVRMTRRVPATDPTGDRIARVWDYALVAGPGDRPAPAPPGPAQVGWHGTTLRIDVPDATSGHAIVLTGQHGTEHALPTSVTDGLATAELDIATTPHPSLGPGSRGRGAEWETGRSGIRPPEGAYRVRLRGPDGAVDVPADVTAPGLIDGYPVLVHSAREVLTVDLGAIDSGLVRRLDPREHRTTESVAGTLLQVGLPEVYASGPGRLRGTVHLGGLALPAEIVATEATGPQLHCYVSGLTGRSPVKLRFGGRAPVVAGVDLVVSPIGGFTLEPAAPPAPKTSAAPTARPTPAADPTPTAAPTPPARPAAVPTTPAPLTKRLRRRVPTVLEPAVQRLATLPPLRALYRRSIRR